MSTTLTRLPAVRINWAEAAKLLTAEDLIQAVQAHIEAALDRYNPVIAAAGYNSELQIETLVFLADAPARECHSMADESVSRVTAFFAADVEKPLSVDEKMSGSFGAWHDGPGETTDLDPSNLPH